MLCAKKLIVVQLVEGTHLCLNMDIKCQEHVKIFLQKDFRNSEREIVLSYKS